MVKKKVPAKKTTINKKSVKKTAAKPIKKPSATLNIVHTKAMIIFLVVSAIIGITATILFISPAIALKFGPSNTNVLSADSLNE